ncbi:hypothetical protein NEOC95_001990 [Neochlamydia sp. AcF95]|nr:hypothetical protein [Neochlamydia sp. AcF95]
MEPHIGHIKNDGKLGRNYLKSCLEDRFNAIYVELAILCV